MSQAENLAIAGSLEEIADLLDAQQANVFRVRAYRHAAATVRDFETPLPLVYERQGRDGFRQLPGIGSTLASALEHFVRTGHYPMLDRLRGESRPEAVLRTVPTIGPKTETELKAHLGIHTLCELEDALNGGALAKVPGMGPKRLATIRRALETRDFDGQMPGEAAIPESAEPSVAELLVLEAQFRDLAAHGKLPFMPPDECDGTHGRRPIWHATRSDRQYTICFSSSRRSPHHHVMPSASDAVTMRLDDAEHEGSWTAFTSRYGALAGKRVVRGREEECRRHYANEDREAELRRQTTATVKRARLEILGLQSPQP